MVVGGQRQQLESNRSTFFLTQEKKKKEKSCLLQNALEPVTNQQPGVFQCGCLMLGTLGW